jgi:poly(3-hydroxybutyrate) depolymerase
MLYTIHDARRRALRPVRLMAEATRMTFVNPYHPLSWTPFGRMMAAGSGVVESLLEEREKPDWNLDGVTAEHVLERPFGDLTRFHGPDTRPKPRVLLAAPMSGHHATLLRDTVRALMTEHEVWVTDWRDAKLVPIEHGTFGVADYIQYIRDFLAFLHVQDRRPVHVIAVCQPAPLVLAATALLAEENAPHAPASMTLMGGPVDTGAAETAVTRVAENRSMAWFERTLIHHVPGTNPGANRRVYPGFLQLRAFWSMNPARHAGAHWSMFRHLSRGDGDTADRTRAFYDEYMSVADVDAAFFLETVDHVFKRRSIPNGTFTWHGRRVRPEAIRDIGLMTVEGELDDISAPAQTEAAQDLCVNIPDHLRDHLLQPKVGHYGIFNGRRWREIIRPRITEFINRIEAGGARDDAA